MDKNKDYIDELNWYSEDFDPVEPKSSSKGSKKEKGSKHSSSNEKRRMMKSPEYPSKRSSSSRYGYVDLDSPSHKSVISSPTKIDKKAVKRTREIVTINPPIRKSLKRDKPDIKLYEPIKSPSRIKQMEAVFNPPMKALPKVVKNEMPKPLVRVETVKVPEPIVTNFIAPLGSKSSANNKEMQVLTEKLSLLEERDKLIRSSLEKPSNLKQARSVRGICPDMCPEKERLMRSLKKMVSVFECFPNSNEMDPKLAIKEYARSSADQEEPLPHDLRPEPVLTMSMSYIINRVITTFEVCEDVSVWYDFCWNRLRAIRKDIVQQQLCDLETVTIVEQCARFHIICFDRFWGADSSIFDEKINTENLMNCLKILLNLYGDLQKQGVVCPNEPEFNAYMILIKMNSGDILWEFLNFPLSLQQTPQVIEAVKIHMFYNSNMYSQFFSYLNKTTYLNACLMQRCFTQLRVNALEAIVKTYCPPSKEGRIPLQLIMKSLKFDTKEDALLFCQSCSIRYIERVGFKISHTIFVRPQTALKAKTPSSLVCNKRVDFAQAMVGVNYEMPVYFDHTVHNSFLNEKQLHSDALDASDQEEKMLRDDVERKLLLKSLKNSPVKDNLRNASMMTPTTPTVQRSLSSLSNRRLSMESDSSPVKSLEVQLPTPVIEDVEDVEMDELSESEDYDTPNALPEPEKIQIPEPDAVDSHKILPLIEEEEDDDDDSLLSSKDDLGLLFNSQQISPLSALSEEVSDLEDEMEEDLDIEEQVNPVNIPEMSPPVISKPFTIAAPAPILVRTNSNDLPSINNNTVPPISPRIAERRPSVSSVLENKFSPYLLKLKSKLKLNLERLSAKKYGRIWRERVREIKRSYGFVPLISHMNMKEYLKAWGHSTSKQSSIWNQLSNTKKLCSSVDSLLFFNLFDTSNKNLGHLISESLVSRKSLQMAPHSFQQKGPIYWKLVISVPSSKVSSYDLYEEVLSWCEQVFFTSEVARNTKIETAVCKGIKVHCKFVVTDGDTLDSGQNLSSLIMLRVPGWESTRESQSRLNKLISLSNYPVSICVINLAPSNTSLIPPSKLSAQFYSEVFAGSVTLKSILTELASNSYHMFEKSMHICDLVNEMLDKFIDALQEDCLNCERFSNAMSNPSNIIYVYNTLINKFKNEITNYYKTNIYGTANEILSSITLNSKYSGTSLLNVIREYFESLILNNLKWPPHDSNSLLLTFKIYCEKAGIAQFLSQIIRMINPPDDEDLDNDHLLTDFLNDLNWLQIMEVIIKGHFRTKFSDVIITYSEKSVNDLVDSHWWMGCSLIV